MRLTMILAAGALMLGTLLPPGAGSARAQAVGGGAYRGALPGYYYSPGGYSGGYYFSPGYYPLTGSTPTVTPSQNAVSSPRTVPSGGASTPGYFGSSTTVGSSRPRGRNYDPSTGRTNIPVPLAKPWLRPLR